MKPGITVEEFARMANQKDKEDGMSKVAMFLGSGLEAVTEDEPLPNRRAVTSYKDNRPKIIVERDDE